MLPITGVGQTRNHSAEWTAPQQAGLSFISQCKNEALDREVPLATRAIAELKQLADDVQLYRSLGEFEAEGRLARVSHEVFNSHLQEAIGEIELITSNLSESRLRIEITNALDSYRDGAFWWSKMRPALQIVNVSKTNFAELHTTPSEEALMSTVPYTVAIHWRQAGKYLERADRLLGKLLLQNSTKCH